jgi:hypothetical protein
MIFEMMMLVLSICLCIFEAIKLDDYFSSRFSARLNLMFCVIMEIFTFSLLGEQIQQESQMISNQIYNGNWYNFTSSKNPKISKTFKALMNMTMMRAERVVEISAGGISTMSYETFMTVS